MVAYRKAVIETEARHARKEGFDHSRIDLDGDDPAGVLEEADSQVACAGADLKDGVGEAEAGESGDGVEDAGVGKQVLAAAFVEAEGTVPRLGATGGSPIASVVVVVVEAAASGFGAEVEVEREKGRKAGGEMNPAKFSSPHQARGEEVKAGNGKGILYF